MFLSVVKMGAPTADQIVKAMEGLHFRFSEMEKSKPDPHMGMPTPMSQEAVNAFFAPRKGSGPKELAGKNESSKIGYPSSSCSAAAPQPDPEMVMRLAMELAKTMGGAPTMPGNPGQMRVKDKIAIRKMIQGDKKKEGPEFPPGASSGGHRYYIGGESVVRKGAFCGWKRIQEESPPARNWADLAGRIQGSRGLEDAVQEYFRQHPGRNSVEIFR